MIAKTGTRPGVCICVVVWPWVVDGVGLAEPEPGLVLELGIELGVKVDSPDGRSRGGFGIGSV